MGFSYATYLEKKFADTRVKAEIENRAVWAADNVADADHVLLLEIGKDAMCCCRCIIDRTVTPPRVCVDKVVENVAHGLASVFTCERVERYEAEWNKLYTIDESGRVVYDDFNDRFIEPEGLNASVDVALAGLDAMECAVAVVCGEYSTLRPLLYALQRRIGTVRRLDERAALAVNTNKRISFPVEIGKIAFGLNREGITAETIITGKCDPIVVPVDEITLGSTFCSDKKWGDILPNRDADADFGGISAKIVTLGVVIDVFRNIFLNVFTTGRPSLRIVPLSLPFGGFEQVNRNVSTPKPRPTSPQKTSPVRHKTQIMVDDGRQHEEDPQSNFTGTFAFEEVEFPVNDIRRNISTMKRGEALSWLDKIRVVFDRLMSGEIFLCDTNFWVQENPRHKGEMYYGWMIKDLVGKFKKLEHRPYFEITNDVWDEIERHAGNKIAAADAAKTFITDYVAGMKAVVTPDIRPEMKRSAYADPTLMNRIRELYGEGRRITVITNDRGAIYRWIQDVENNLTPGLPVPAYIRNINLERLYRLRRDLMKRIEELKEHAK